MTFQSMPLLGEPKRVSVSVTPTNATLRRRRWRRSRWMRSVAISAS